MRNIESKAMALITGATGNI